MEKENVAEICNGTVFSLLKGEILPFVIIWMNLEDTVLNEKRWHRNNTTAWFYSLFFQYWGSNTGFFICSATEPYPPLCMLWLPCGIQNN